jgi:hypothetical protein
MNWRHYFRSIPVSVYLMVPVLALAYYIAFIPHQGYPFPVHIDEWVHMAYANAMWQAGDTTFTDPFLGQSVIGLGTPHLEAGFHIFWGAFHQISGISWLTIFRYFPGVIFMITVLSVYIFARKQGFGWEAALFACLIPTTVGIMGPAFLVPVAMGLLFVPLALYLAFNFRSVGAYLVLFIFVAFLLSIHAPSAIIVVIILVPYILLNLKGNFKHALGLTLALLVPFLAPFPWIFSMLGPTATRLLTPQVLPTYIDFPRIMLDYGYLPIAVCLLGTFLLAVRGGKKNYGLILGLLAVLVILVTYFVFQYGLDIMYTRGLMFMMLMVSIIAGVGLAGVKDFKIPESLVSRMKVPQIVNRHTGKFLALVLVGVILAVSVPDRQDTGYYHMIDNEDYQAFIWIKENVSGDYGTAILDPWKATAFTAITGKAAYSRTHSFPTPRDKVAEQFLENGSGNTTFLNENKISLIYTNAEVKNPDLTEVRENVYLLENPG